MREILIKNGYEDVSSGYFYEKVINNANINIYKFADSEKFRFDLYMDTGSESVHYIKDFSSEEELLSAENFAKMVLENMK